MEEKYNINEILKAVNDLHKVKKEIINNKSIKSNISNSLIPKDTAKIIEDAEKSLKNK
mgnify:CR=1 FL=1|tara:strand:- start:564 stop:737 length:174 start_codon:yes stop_codon:yes gene_type:complete